jgi:dTDP-4-dehydrorhamnose reductase
MLKLGVDRGEVNVVRDQIGSPTFTFDVARLLVDMLETEKYGTYHATNEGFCSWFDFAQEIFDYSKMDVRVIPVDSDAFATKALRPKNSRLSKSELDKAGFDRLPDWKDALHRYLDQISNKARSK